MVERMIDVKICDPDFKAAGDIDPQGFIVAVIVMHRILQFLNASSKLEKHHLLRQKVNI